MTLFFISNITNVIKCKISINEGKEGNEGKTSL